MHHQVWITMVSSGTFWLNQLMLVTIIVGKDVYVTGLERNFSYKPSHILQEVAELRIITN